MIFRAKLTILLLVVITAMVGVTLSLSASVAEKFGQRAEEHLRSANEVVRLAAGIEGYSAVYEAVEVASLASVVEGLACPTTPEALTAAREPGPEIEGPDGTVTRAPAQTACTRTQHATVLQALKDWDNGRAAGREDNERRELGERDVGFAAPRQPDLLIVSDASGLVVARVGFDKDNWYGEGRPSMQQFPAIAQTELAAVGEILGAQEDMIIWREHEQATPQLMHIGAAALLDGDQYVGTAVVGYLVSNEIADEATQLLFATEVAFFSRGEGDSVGFAGTTMASRPQELNAIGEADFFANSGDDAGTAITFAEFALGEHGSFHTYEYGDATYLALATALSYDGNQVTSGFIVTTSLTSAVSPLAGFLRIIPMLGAALFLIGLLGILVAIRGFMQPVSDVSKGIQEVIAGNHSYMWEVDERSHLSDLAHSLNVMSARLQGMADPDAEDTEGDDDWQAMAGPGEVKTTKPAAVAGLGGLRGRAAADDDEEDEEDEG
ncbi:MAG: hypothetical protein ACJAYU_003566 [Bradymonadia bacterium]